jgi:hypothetical protein
MMNCLQNAVVWLLNAFPLLCDDEAWREAEGSYGSDHTAEVQASSNSGVENLEHVRQHKDLIL